MIAALALAFAADPVAPPVVPPPPAEVIAPAPQPVVVFIHGLYLQGASWSAWEAWFREQGYATIAADWPLHAGEPAALRDQPPEGLRDLDLSRVVEHYRVIIDALPEPPVLVGHSMGGLVVQLLLQEGRGRAGVAIHPAPPFGVSSLAGDFVRANGPLLVGRSPRILSEKAFAWGFANDLTDPAAIRAAWETSVVPESRLAGRGPTTQAAKIAFEARHAPLMLVAGSADHTIPSSLVHRTFLRYAEGDPSSVTRYVEMAGRTHRTCQAPGWEEVALTASRFLDPYRPTERPAEPAVAAPVQAAIDARRGELAACADRERRKLPALTGAYTLEFQVADGAVAGAAVVGDSTGSAGLAACVTAAASGWTFPGVGPLRVRLPVDVAPK